MSRDPPSASPTSPRPPAGTANRAARKYLVTTHGEQAHPGATHRACRRDALVSTSGLVLAAHGLTDAFTPARLLTSVEQLAANPPAPQQRRGGAG